jgi:hypothetical protein
MLFGQWYEPLPVDNLQQLEQALHQEKQQHLP